jgi:hypothetical protein
MSGILKAGPAMGPFRLMYITRDASRQPRKVSLNLR